MYVVTAFDQYREILRETTTESDSDAKAIADSWVGEAYVSRITVVKLIRTITIPTKTVKSEHPQY